MVFIACALTSAVVVFFFFPDTLGKPLEEVAAMFGDDDLVAIYQKDVVLDKDDDGFMTTQTEKLEEVKS